VQRLAHDVDQESASFNAPSSLAGSVTLEERTPKASATRAWSVTPKSTEK
jgi:hypothetical protein